MSAHKHIFVVKSLGFKTIRNYEGAMKNEEFLEVLNIFLQMINLLIQ